MSFAKRVGATVVGTVLGGFVGSLLLGPGAGTALGAKIGAVLVGGSDGDGGGA